MEPTIYSLFPPLLMILLVLLTRKVLLSLGAGIVAGALVIHDFHIMNSYQEIVNALKGLFIDEGAIALGSIYLITFLLFLGIVTAFMTASGGTKAFGEWAITKIKTKRGAQLLPSTLGIVIFIDDYFNSLAVGQIARPLTDRHRVSRAKLAYIIDSTSAPVAVLAPISSWGAYIIGTIGGIITANQLGAYQPLESFLTMIPMNFYAITAVVLVFVVSSTNLNIGAMRTHEWRAEQTGELVDPNRKDIPGNLTDEFLSVKTGRIIYLAIPIVTLIIATVGAMVWTGIQNSKEEDLSLITIFSNTEVNFSLFLGGLSSIGVSFLLYVLQKGVKSSILNVFAQGIKSMLPAIYILLLAWMLGSIIDVLQTGEYLAIVVEEAKINASFLPAIIFVMCGLMAFATGTSWGTFGIMLPIAGEIAVNTDVQLFLPALAAVLAGSVFGDHCSPISDTTILSSTGAGSNHIDHVQTQLPYAILVAIGSIIGYIILGFTGEIVLSLFTSIIMVVVVAIVLKYMQKTY
ncbi:Na+/H+ antiporter NhaC [Salirhabdus euzebyi]|uniref:Na+/H+ antiporter NhaC n=1 Tax=Salirhabdus euzebyi TaxID=394506 RepID=A0A841Q4W9_9BACI|nr:Na+/H+ antiporter NhaC family protein [Salirhabdus euzebyi]MBB6453451.1 Na+/H+ antiporter NhaC [Salirhabdus euzebyi]